MQNNAKNFTCALALCMYEVRHTVDMHACVMRQVCIVDEWRVVAIQ